jgi:predicted dehydrogenase
MKKITIVGLGHWGPNYLRNFAQMDGCEVVACADMNAARLKTFQKDHPGVHFYETVQELYAKETPDATVIATPTSTHYALAKEALGRKQHVLIEKPLTTDEKECAELTELAQKQDRILMVGHTFLYNSAIVWLKNFLKEGQAGKIYYLYAVRTNLGPIRTDVNAMVDLAPHDISTFLFLLGKDPTAVSAQGAAFLEQNREDVTFLTLYFDGGVIGHVHVSWLDPRKVRQTTVIGDKKMVVFDDINIFEPIRIYDKGVVRQSKDISDFTQFKAVLHEGDVTIPKVSMGEPLKNQCREFLDCIENRRHPLSDGRFGTTVTRVLSGAMKSLRQNGEIIPLK